MYINITCNIIELTLYMQIVTKVIKKVILNKDIKKRFKRNKIYLLSVRKNNKKTQLLD